MSKLLENILGKFKIRTKLTVGFFSIFGIFLAVGVMQWINLEEMNASTSEIMSVAPYVEISKEMRFIVATELTNINRLMLEEDTSAMDVIWKDKEMGFLKSDSRPLRLD